MEIIFAGNLTLWGAVWAQCLFCTHFGRKRCVSELAPIYLCFRMLCNKTATLSLWQGYWESL